ncbi:DAK2 domain fusion protein YloV [Breznakia sp. PF5-3]|uniref:DAK2 domain-containing protein n=1 Tax=unclassified Breznakia TaxID=2623764 RepID=UPI002407741B|nr:MULTISPECIES: DAK2 domain-containing protein [unclassified Breznakia]MDL2276452.1 DAK2 domain-containing protein [Breznakia sp. OttesenSCG-928-G09]MDF9825022.1 DAK2 domain fusion protein YloV [Breznakia sp. PM6-1]MDF9835407.1 DAK2 domain fusion protein YloV [Breznakia sp. PF5-3]MDF9837639.1 DAK2 domain fusion protein YloV [Breznakia sp. PFB2-8]MDF9859503.1 DAK2 domain fusion protein YloV [Breznakia sp. PH5-24]
MENLNGLIFKEMIESGSNNLANHYQEVDTLNVFPVPDGDTGTNMSLTFSSGVNDALKVDSENINDVAKALSKGLLMGARGNSGVITSQIFRGLYQAVENETEVNGLKLANAFVNGSRVAYKAVMRPVEGTILTVIREASDYTLVYASENINITCVEVMEKLVEEAKKSLERTPELLPVLKEVGVVDSGGAGLVYILEGFLASLRGEKIEKSESAATTNSNAAQVESDEFGYCTEFIIRLDENNLTTFKEDKLRKSLGKLGDSLVVVQDDDIVKVHVHTLKPGDVLNMGQRYGEFVKLKIENMQEQHDHLVLDSKDDGNSAKPKEKYALIAVAAGEGLMEMFSELRVNTIISGGQTMNPSTEDFVEAIKKINAEHIFIMPNNSNIILAAQQAAQVLDDLDIHVIPSKSIPQGLCACMMFNPEVDVDTNVMEMSEAITHVVTGQVTYAIKDTTFDGMKIKAQDYMGIKEKEIVCSVKDKMDATKKLIDSMVDDDSEIVTLIAGEDTSKEELEKITKYTEAKGVEVEATMGNQPVYSFVIGVE